MGGSRASESATRLSLWQQLLSRLHWLLPRDAATRCTAAACGARNLAQLRWREQAASSPLCNLAQRNAGQLATNVAAGGGGVRRLLPGFTTHLLQGRHHSEARKETGPRFGAHATKHDTQPQLPAGFWPHLPGAGGWGVHWLQPAHSCPTLTTTKLRWACGPPTVTVNRGQRANGTGARRHTLAHTDHCHRVSLRVGPATAAAPPPACLLLESCCIVAM